VSADQNLDVNADVKGTLRLSKGAWLFAPDGVDVLLRVDPVPAPATDGFLSQSARVRLVVHGHVVTDVSGGDAIRPRTGVPSLLLGTVLGVLDGALVVDTGVAFMVRGAGASIVGATVAVAVDDATDARGIRCELR